MIFSWGIGVSECHCRTTNEINMKAFQLGISILALKMIKVLLYAKNTIFFTNLKICLQEISILIRFFDFLRHMFKFLKV